MMLAKLFVRVASSLDPFLDFFVLLLGSFFYSTVGLSSTFGEFNVPGSIFARVGGSVHNIF